MKYKVITAKDTGKSKSFDTFEEAQHYAKELESIYGNFTCMIEFIKGEL
jgi:hypothetical protein